MTPANLLSGAGNAAQGYTAEFVGSIVRGLPKILLLFLPFFYFVVSLKIRNQKDAVRQPHLENTAPEPEKKAGKPLNRSIAAAAAGLLCMVLLAATASRGAYGSVYGAQFDYNQATNIFGLITSTRLSLQYKMFGNHHTGFQIAESFENDDASGSVSFDSESGKEAGDPFHDDEIFLQSKELEGAFGTEKDIVWTLTSENAETAKTSKKMKDGGKTAGTSPDVENDGGDTTGTSPDSETGGRDTGADAIHGSEGNGSGGKNGGQGADADAQSVSGNGEAGEKDGEQKADPAEQSVDPAEQSVDPAEQSTDPAEQSADPAEQNEDPAEEAVPEEYGLHEMDLPLSDFEKTGKDSVDSLTAYIESLTPASENKYTGIFEGKNLILICAESYCDAFISEELTPTLWRLSRNGFYFSEYYQPEWGGSTTTGEASFLLGLAPKDGDQTMLQTIGNNMYFTMGNQLQRLGYSSVAFHGGDDAFYHRNETHKNLGYNQFLANHSGMGDLCGNIYPRDTLAFEKTMDLYLTHEPFSVYYMTISGHAPYKGDHTYVKEYYDRVDAAVGDRFEEKTKYYICYQMELEEALSLMVAKLEEAGIADDTVIALVGDHYPYGLGRGEAWGNDKDYINDLIKGDDTVPYEEDRNGLIIWSGCLENEYKDLAAEITDPVFSLDILPTLSNLFGLPYDSRLLAGRDVFSDEEAIVFWNNLSWVTKYGKYDARHDVFTPRDSEENDADAAFPEDMEAYRNRIDKIIQNKILLSRTIMETDYYGLLMGPDDITTAGDILYPES